MSSLQSIAWLGLIIAGAIALVTTSSASESHQAEVRLPVPICPPKDSEPRYHAGTRIPIVEQDATNLLLVSHHELCTCVQLCNFMLPGRPKLAVCILSLPK